MKIDDNGNNKIVLKVAVLSVALVTMIEAGISPALPGIAKAFPKVDISVIQLAVNMPGLLVIPCSLLCGIIAKFISKKTLTISALILFIITSCAPALVNSFTFLLVMRALSGASCGFLLTLSSALIPDFFHGKEQESMQGYKNAVGNFGGIITSFFGGILATINWQVTFWVFLIAIIPITLTTLFLPKSAQTDEIEESSDNKAATDTSKSSNALYMIFLCAGFFVYMVFYFGFYTNASFVIVQEHLGNAANAGFVFTLATIGGVISGLIFGKVSNIFKRYTGSLAIGLTAVCFLIFSTTKSMTVYYIAGFLFGASFAMMMSNIFVVAASKVSKASTTMWFSVLSCVQGLGGFSSSLILMPIAKALGGASIYRSVFMFSAVCLVIGCIITIAFSVVNAKSTKEIAA